MAAKQVRTDEVTDDQLTPEEFEDIMESIEKFQDEFLIRLAGTERYDVLPTITEEGKPLTSEQYKMAKAECTKNGVRLLYMTSVNNSTLIINPNSLKMGIISEELH